MLNALVISLHKPVLHKLKILGFGKLEYCKSMGGMTKGGIMKFSGGSKRRGHNFSLKFSVG